MDAKEFAEALGGMNLEGYTLQSVTLSADEVKEIIDRFDPEKGHKAIAAVVVPQPGKPARSGRKILEYRLARRTQAEGASPPGTQPEQPPPPPPTQQGGSPVGTAHARMQSPEEGTIVALLIAPTDLELD